MTANAACIAACQTAAPRPAGRPLTRRHKLLLLLAFEVLVLGFTQARISDPPQRGISIETTVTPNHVVT